LVGILAAQRPAADGDAGAVVVDDELLARQAVVALRPSAGEVADTVEADQVGIERRADPGEGALQPGRRRRQLRHDELVDLLGADPWAVLDGDVAALPALRPVFLLEVDEHLPVGPEPVGVLPAGPAEGVAEPAGD